MIYHLEQKLKDSFYLERGNINLRYSPLNITENQFMKATLLEDIPNLYRDLYLFIREYYSFISKKNTLEIIYKLNDIKITYSYKDWDIKNFSLILFNSSDITSTCNKTNSRDESKKVSLLNNTSIYLPDILKINIIDNFSILDSINL